MAIQLRQKRASGDNDTASSTLAKEETPELEMTSTELTVLDLGDEPKLECKPSFDLFWHFAATIMQSSKRNANQYY